MFDGWPKVYFYFAERFRMSPDEVDRTPLYLACLMMGAIGPDHENVRMSPADVGRYYGAEAQRLLGV